VSAPDAPGRPMEVVEVGAMVYGADGGDPMRGETVTVPLYAEIGRLPAGRAAMPPALAWARMVESARQGFLRHLAERAKQ